MAPWPTARRILKRSRSTRIESIGEMEVYDIQTESGEYLSGDLRVHNCFILSVDDSMDSILNWYREEGVIFKGGSGAGVNLSRIRASVENLQGGGTASGPVSFMRGADASAGTIKSGGKTRRAAKMVILDVDHPDIEDFIWCKALEEKKARVLRDAGFNMDLDGSDAFSIQYQNANNSVRVTDEFMQAVLDDADWNLLGRMDRTPVRTVRARDLYRQLAKATWECADPGMQFDTTINRWHTAPNAGRINGSNPCFPGSALVHTDKGMIRFSELFDRANRGEAFGVYTHDATNPDAPAERVELTSPEAFMITGFNDIVRLRFDNGMELRCTPGHRVFTANRGFVEAKDLTKDDEVKVLDVPAPAVNADLGLPVSSDPDGYRQKGDHGELPAPPRRVDAGVRPLPGMAHRRREHLGYHHEHDLRQRRGPHRDPSRPRRVGRVDQRGPSPEDLRAGQRDGPTAAVASAVQGIPGSSGCPLRRRPAEDGALVDRAGAGLGRGLVPPGPLRRRRLCGGEPGQGFVRRTGIGVT